LRESVNHWLLPVKEVRVTIGLSKGGKADRLKAMRGPGESYSDVIIRVARG
jgi:hypothetical protein